MPATFVILIRRWPEVVLITALALFSTLGLELVWPHMGKDPSFGVAILLIGTLFFYLMQMVLHLGFVRTAYTNGAEAQEPAALFRAGGGFFWRFVIFELAYSALYALMGVLVFFVLHTVGVIKTGLNETGAWVQGLCFTAGSLLAAKLILLPPAVVIVRDCGIIRAVLSIRNFRLLSAREPLILFVIWLVVKYFTAVLMPEKGPVTAGRYFHVVVFTLLSALIILAVSISIVRFVARSDIKDIFINQQQHSEDIDK